MLDVLDRSSWVTERLIEMPALLDELLTLDAVDAEMSREAIGQELSMRLQRVDPGDPERLNECSCTSLAIAFESQYWRSAVKFH